MEASNQIAAGASVRIQMSLMPWSLDWLSQTLWDLAATSTASVAAAGSASMTVASIMVSSRPHDNECAQRATRRSTVAATSTLSCRVPWAVLRPTQHRTCPA
jgi:hypothetical protein